MARKLKPKKSPSFSANSATVVLADIMRKLGGAEKK
jgi:hypothetical protein